MGLLGLSRKQKETWASIVIQGIKPGMQIDDALLKNATEIYISQHIRILEDSVRLVMESKNQKTREERYDLSLQHFDALSKIQKYADKKQKKRIADAQDQFMIMNENLFAVPFSHRTACSYKHIFHPLFPDVLKVWKESADALSSVLLLFFDISLSQGLFPVRSFL